MCKQAAIESCPVDCIHWTTRTELPALEYMTQKMSQRVNVGAMMGGAGGHIADVFHAAERFVKSRAKRCGLFVSVCGGRAQGMGFVGNSNLQLA